MSRTRHYARCCCGASQATESLAESVAWARAHVCAESRPAPVVRRAARVPADDVSIEEWRRRAARFKPIVEPDDAAKAWGQPPAGGLSRPSPAGAGRNVAFRGPGRNFKIRPVPR